MCEVCSWLDVMVLICYVYVSLLMFLLLTLNNPKSSFKACFKATTKTQGQCFRFDQGNINYSRAGAFKVKHEYVNQKYVPTTLSNI